MRARPVFFCSRGMLRSRETMSTPVSRHRRRWWKVIAYEVWMLRGMTSIPANHPIRGDQRLANSVDENILLHTRSFCDFCTSGRSSDIKPSDLFDNYATDPQYRVLNRLMRRLDRKYARGGKGSARWAFNKKLAHPTKVRGASFNYTRYAMRVLPVLQDVIAELERIRGRGLESLL
jgi:hypothetical protein